jgi:hypothetical protein
MTVEELRVFLYAIANNDQTGNKFTPSDYNSYLARANEDKFRKEYGLPESWVPGSTPLQIGWQVTQNSTDALRRFVEFAVIPLTAGVGPLPPGYVHVSSAHTQNAGTDPDGVPFQRTVPVTMLPENKVGERLGHPYLAPEEMYPIGTLTGNNIMIWPTSSVNVSMYYLRMPVTPVWGYTIANDEPVYNPVTSVQMEWPEVYHIDIARLILGYMGIFNREPQLSQYAEMVKMKGI